MASSQAARSRSYSPVSGEHDVAAFLEVAHHAAQLCGDDGDERVGWLALTLTFSRHGSRSPEKSCFGQSFPNALTFEVLQTKRCRDRLPALQMCVDCPFDVGAAQSVISELQRESVDEC